MKLSAILTLFAIAITSHAQLSTGGPDLFGYTYKTSTAVSGGPTYQWFDISSIGINVSGLGDDNFVGPYNISGFSYYGSSPTQLYIGSNGFISFNPVNIASVNAQFPSIPSLGSPNDYIAPMLTDLTFGGAASNPATAYYYDQGDTICVTFEGVPFWTNNTNQYAGDNSFQIILNKADSSITFNYKKQVGSPDPTYTMNYLTIGIENGNGSDGLQYYRGTVFPGPNYSIHFEHPSTPTPVTDVELAYIDNPKSGAIFITDNSSFTPSVNVENRGNQDVSSRINVTTEIRNSFGAVVYTDTNHIDSLAAGIDSLVNFTPYFPTSTDKFEVKSYITAISNDMAQINDSNLFFFKTIDTSSVSQTLDYSNGTTGIGIGWIGGNGGVGIYLEPPYYPAQINAANYFITLLGTPPVGFHSIVYDDNGRGPGQGTILDSNYIAPTNITTGQFHRVPMSNSVIIPSGGIYLLWLMDGDGINLARNIVNVSSKRTFEVISGTWSAYRDMDTEDFVMNVEISPVIPVGLNETKSDREFNLFPNPSKDVITVRSDKSFTDSDIFIYDVKGNRLSIKMLRYENELRLFKGNHPNGTYFLVIDRVSKPFIFTD